MMSFVGSGLWQSTTVLYAQTKGRVHNRNIWRLRGTSHVEQASSTWAESAEEAENRIGLDWIGVGCRIGQRPIGGSRKAVGKIFPTREYILKLERYFPWAYLLECHFFEYSLFIVLLSLSLSHTHSLILTLWFSPFSQFLSFNPVEPVMICV